MTLIAESESPAATSLAPVLRQIVLEIDRDMAVFDARSMQDIYIATVRHTEYAVSRTAGQAIRAFG